MSMGYEPTVHCRFCDEPLDVYAAFEDRFCSEECAVDQQNYEAGWNAAVEAAAKRCAELSVAYSPLDAAAFIRKLKHKDVEIKS